MLSAVGGGWGSLTIIPIYAHPRTRHIARPLAVVLAVTAVTVFVLKKIVGRPRPFMALSGIQAEVFEPPSDFSFPSGHAAGSFAFAVFFALLLWKKGPWGRAGAVGLCSIAVGVALSRIALGVHFPGDVLAGAILGTAIAVVGSRLSLRSTDLPVHNSLPE